VVPFDRPGRAIAVSGESSPLGALEHGPAQINPRQEFVFGT
jgi:hypothetical protein